MTEYSLFACPICGSALEMEKSRLFCENGHSFDRARQGYTHLLPPNRMHSKEPGDTREMVLSRRAFLESGAYDCFADRLCELVWEALCEIPEPFLLDAGCGEGYYTGKMESFLRGKGLVPRVAGFDISKSAVRTAAGKYKTCQFAVASAFAVPASDGCADCLTNVFAPIVPEECARVVKPGGMMILAVPGPRHLYGLKEILYDAPYENEYRETEYPGFVFVRRETVCQTMTLDDAEQIQNLFAMTPYYWKTPESGSRRLAETNHLETEIRFDFLLYQRK